MNSTEFPPQETFYSKLKQEGISDEDYLNAKKVFDNDCKTFADYTIMYLKQDVKLLAKVFEKFRDKCIDEYKIDPCYRYSSPGLSWICGSKFTEQRLKHYQKDTYDILLMIEKGIRCGIASILGDRYVKPWNRYTQPEHYEINKLCKLLDIMDFDPLHSMAFDSNKAQEDYLLYYDFNSLYPSCMVEELPIGEFIKCNDLLYETTKDGDFGVIYEINIKYSNDLKQKTEVFPYFPEISKSYTEEFTNYQEVNKPNKYKPLEKLMLTLHDKNNYVIEGRMLDWYLNNGVKLEDITFLKKIKYEKSKWLKPYIEYNVKKRDEAKANNDKFGEMFYKLMSNSFYGKTLENVRNRQDVEIVNKLDRCKQLVGKATYKSTSIFSNNLVAIHNYRSVFKQDKFNYIGFVILELSKLKIYEFVYNVLKPIYNNNFSLCYMDTDGLHIHLKDDPNKMKEYIGSKLGQMKDELKNEYITEAIFLAPKVYYFETTKEQTLKAKGVTKPSQKHQLNRDDYYNALFNNENKYVEQFKLRSIKHDMNIVNEKKLALSPFDDKRIVDGVKTKPYGSNI